MNLEPTKTSILIRLQNFIPKYKIFGVFMVWKKEKKLCKLFQNKIDY